MWTDNTIHADIRGGGHIEVFKILKGFENVDCNIQARVQGVGSMGTNEPPFEKSTTTMIRLLCKLVVH